MRAPFRKQTKLIGSKWLRNGDGEEYGRNNAVAQGDDRNKHGNSGIGNDAKSVAENQGNRPKGYDSSVTKIQTGETGAGSTQSALTESAEVANRVANVKESIKIVENKKRHADESGLDQELNVGLNTELNLDSEEEDGMNVDQTNGLGSKNGLRAGSGNGARLAL